jgi:hypothetical protein
VENTNTMGCNARKTNKQTLYYKTKIFLAVIASKIRSGKGKRMRGSFTIY